MTHPDLVEHAGIRRALDRGEIGRLLGEQLLDPAGVIDGNAKEEPKQLAKAG